MPVTAHCPKCKRLAYFRNDVCEFCGYELPPEVVGRHSKPFGTPGSIYEEDFPPGVGLSESEARLRARALGGPKMWSVTISFSFRGPTNRAAAWAKATNMAESIAPGEVFVASLTEGEIIPELIRWRRRK